MKNLILLLFIFAISCSNKQLDTKPDIKNLTDSELAEEIVKAYKEFCKTGDSILKLEEQIHIYEHTLIINELTKDTSFVPTAEFIMSDKKYLRLIINLSTIVNERTEEETWTKSLFNEAQKRGKATKQ